MVSSSNQFRRLVILERELSSDLPLDKDGIKTKQSSQWVFDTYTADHVEKGVKILKHARLMQSKKIKGAYHRNINDEGAFV